MQLGQQSWAQLGAPIAGLKAADGAVYSACLWVFALFRCVNFLHSFPWFCSNALWFCSIADSSAISKHTPSVHEAVLAHRD